MKKAQRHIHCILITVMNCRSYSFMALILHVKWISFWFLHPFSCVPLWLCYLLDWVQSFFVLCAENWSSHEIAYSHRSLIQWLLLSLVEIFECSTNSKNGSSQLCWSVYFSSLPVLWATFWPASIAFGCQKSAHLSNWRASIHQSIYKWYSDNA